MPAVAIIPIPPSLATAEARPDREIPTPIPPCIMGSLAVNDPILKFFRLLKLMKNLLYLLCGNMPHVKSYLL